jgi:hypothetical protein
MNQNLSYELDGIMPAVIATGLLVSLFTAQAPSSVLGGTGAPDGSYSNVLGLVNIACTVPPYNFSDTSIRADEMKAIPEIAATGPLHVLLDSNYPLLAAGWRSGWRCLIDGTNFDILGVESDSQSKMTRVSVRLVTT